MAWITDSLRNAIRACGRLSLFGRGEAMAPGIFTHELARAAYMSSGLLRKVITIPAEDRVREWRDWQADKDAIALIEAEERRLGLIAKVRQAEVLRGVGGGALILVTAGDHSMPLRAETISKGGLIAVNVVSRWQIQGKDWIDELTDPRFGEPAMFEVSGGRDRATIHPSRVICFRGEPMPAGAAMGHEEAFWGDSRLLRVFREVQNADNAQLWFAELVKKAKLLRVGIPQLSEYLETDDGKRRIEARVQTIAEGESILNATVFDSGNGEKGGGEAITDYQVTWAGIPAIMDAFDQRVAAVADIPVTRLFGRSPGGMNATGKSDQDNWNKMVASGQKLETRPCLEQIDPILLRSSGVSAPDEVTWRWAPLDTPSEKEEADTFNVAMQAIEKLQNTGTVPEIALAKGVQNWLAEREYLPGLEQALAEVPEGERFPVSEPDDDFDEDPSALREGGDPQSGRRGGGRVPSARRANDGGAPTGGHPFADAGNRSRAHRESRAARASNFDPTQPRDRNGRWIPTGRRNYIDAAARGSTGFGSIAVGQLTASARERIGRAGVAIKGDGIALDASMVRHIAVKHATERGGQRSVTGSDIASAASLLNGARAVRRGHDARNGSARFIALTRSRGERIYSVFEVRKRAVTLVTMWKRK